MRLRLRAADERSRPALVDLDDSERLECSECFTHGRAPYSEAFLKSALRRYSVSRNETFIVDHPLGRVPSRW